MVKKEKQLYYVGKIEKVQKRLNVFILELDKNKEIAETISDRFNVIWYTQETKKNSEKKEYIKIAKLSKGNLYMRNNICREELMYYLMKISDVIIVGKVTNIKVALDIIDMGLAMGKEIICIKNSGYVVNKLIKDGAMCV